MTFASPDAAPATVTQIATTWAVLHTAVAGRLAVRARYHDRVRILCPHALGWKHGRPKVLAFQRAIVGDQPTHDPRGWRSLFVDEITDAVLSDDRWQSAANYTPNTTGIDTLAAAVS